jgi:Xaa-Pro dipeptidase
LKEGETEPPEHIQLAWEVAVQSNRKMNAAMVPGTKGWEVDKVQIEWQASQGSLRHWAGAGHPVGYWAHDLGPGLREYYADKPPSSPRAERKLESGMVFAYDGVYVWPATYDGVEGTISITVEEMSCVMENGGEYLSPVQDDLVLIPYPEHP